MTEEGGGWWEEKEIDYCSGISLDMMRFLPMGQCGLWSTVCIFKSS